jgi:hypothetical protein
MKLLYIILPALCLVACAGQHNQSPASVGDAPLPESDAIREPGRVHTYIVNDYVDPNNPRLRHRGHLVDVVEQDEKWNFAPTDTTETDLGPITAVNDPNAAPNPYSAEFETELAQQRDQYRQLADLGGKMTAQMTRLQDMAQKSADVVSENTELRSRLGELQQEIDTLKPASPSVVPPPTKKPSWWDSILNLFWQPPQGKPLVAEKMAMQTNYLLRPAITNAPPAAPTNAADDSDEATIPPPGEMSTNEVIQF